MGLRISGGSTRGRLLQTRKALQARPTTERVRSALFSILGSRVIAARALDLFAGTGSLGLEALSRGAAWVDFVEAVPRQCSSIRASLHSLGFREQAGVYCVRVERALSFLQGPYDIVLMDPPYELEGLGDLLLRLGQSPLLGANSLLVLEHSRRWEPEGGYGSLVLLRRQRYGDSMVSIYQVGSKSW